MPLPTLLTNADANQIRATIRSDLVTSDVPDAIVSMAFAPATRQVLAIDELAGTWGVGSDQAIADHDAAVLFAAAWLLPMIPLVVRESFQGYSYGLDPGLALAERIATLRQMAQALLAEALDADMLELMLPDMFVLAEGGRGDISDLPAWGIAGRVTVWP